MDISIKITSNVPSNFDGKQYLQGKIKIGDFEETIFILLGRWTQEDYERQWKEGLARLKTHDKSCLVISVDNPEHSAVIGWWPLYRKKNTVFVRMGYLSHMRYKKLVGEAAFTRDTCYSFVKPRKNIKAKGIFRTSEWSVPWLDQELVE